VENRSKERLTGALILVAILVLLVPEMLSGRGIKAPAAGTGETGRPTVTYTLPSSTDPLAANTDQSALTGKVPDLTQPVLPGRENVVAVLPGADRSRRIILEAHMDTVMATLGKTHGPDALPGIVKDGAAYLNALADADPHLARASDLMRASPWAVTQAAQLWRAGVRPARAR
jgi:cell division septation protein DedD